MKNINIHLYWWGNLSLEEQFYKTIKNKSFLGGDASRHPFTLTELEIEKIYNNEKT